VSSESIFFNPDKFEEFLKVLFEFYFRALDIIGNFRRPSKPSSIRTICRTI
jgi:hypothetical protein